MVGAFVGLRFMLRVQGFWGLGFKASGFRVKHEEPQNGFGLRQMMTLGVRVAAAELALIAA